MTSGPLGAGDDSPDWFETSAVLSMPVPVRIDASIDDGFIIQRLSTGDAHSVHLRRGIVPDDQAVLGRRIRNERAHGRTVGAGDIDTVERMGDALSFRLLTTPPEELLDYGFGVADMSGDRADVINKDMPRDGQPGAG